jgi:hypothetical protein
MREQIDRRRFVLGAAGAVATAAAYPAAGVAAGFREVDDQVQAVPSPIPGGIDLGGGKVIHVWAPGDPNVTLPYSKLTLFGFDAEPTTIGNFRGSSALAYHVGSATGSDGKTYNVETDVRAFSGEYVVNGATQRGSFVFI